MQPELFPIEPKPAPSVTLYRQDAFTLRNVATGLRLRMEHPDRPHDGGRAWTLPGLLAQASDWTGHRYTAQDAARALADMQALTAQAEEAPSMTAAEARARMDAARRRR
jgi:hypothetical protein